MTRTANVNTLKNDHSVSLIAHKLEVPDLIRARSAELLPSRGAAYPAHSADMSSELVKETHFRRSLHKKILETDPFAFRKKEHDEGTGKMIKERMHLENYLGTMHPVKDVGDINEKRRKNLSYSRRKELDERERKAREDYKYDSMRPLDDFLRPEDSTVPRHTGYEHGHVRSLLKLDVFGPASSMSASLERETGLIPPSPNVDRFAISEPQQLIRSTLYSPATRGSDASTVSSSSIGRGDPHYFRFPEVKHLRSISRDKEQGLVSPKLSHSVSHPAKLERAGSNNSLHDDMRKLFHDTSEIGSSGARGERSKAKEDMGVALESKIQFGESGPLSPLTTTALRTHTATTSGSSNLVNPHHLHSHYRHHHHHTPHDGLIQTAERVKAGTLGYHGPAVTVLDRQYVDPYVRRQVWTKSFLQRNADRENYRAATAKHKEKRQKQKVQAFETRESIDSFERHLVLAKLSVK